MLSFSTCWNSHRHTEGEDLVREFLEMGVDTIEVSHGLKISLLPGIQKMHQEGQIRVSGVHNFCPSPVELMIDAPDAYEFTSHRAFDRDRAFNLTVKTIETAAGFGARYVVLHLGSVPVRSFTAKLEELAREGGLNSREFVKVKLEAVRTREKAAGLYLRRARETVERLVEHAEQHRIVLAIESRSHYEQVPSEREMVALMEHFADCPWVGYWHDFGHVQRKANLDLLDHEEWLRRMAPHLVGCHLHDVIWPERDHRVPFQGTIEYDRLMPLVPPGLPIVWELSPRRRRRDVKAALPEWRERFPAAA